MTVTAKELGLVSCHACRLVSRPSLYGDSGCPRCGARLHRRKRDSLARTTSLLLAATILFVPANLLPVMTTRSLLEVDSDTILSGVVSLWRAGSWPIAILVFVASIMVPLLKIGALALLVASCWGRSTWRPRARTRLYRLLEVIGRWSMLDIFVMGVLAALVHARAASVEINVGAIPFAAVVVLTMFASMSFDPRLIWDAARPRSQKKTIPSIRKIPS